MSNELARLKKCESRICELETKLQAVVNLVRELAIQEVKREAADEQHKR